MDGNGIGLALGGGAARGWAHIGVLKALESAGMKPGVIAGTSIGAVVGGCYAAGKLAQLEEFVRVLTPNRMLRFLDLDVSGSGLMSGARLYKTLDKELAGLQIEELGIAFAAVATEIGTGREIWLTKGSLLHAVRASSALPGILRPVQINGRWLMDGAFVNPVPVAVCKALGARFVIAVNLHAGGMSRTVLTPLEDAATGSLGEEIAPSKKRRIPRLRSFRHQVFGKGKSSSSEAIGQVNNGAPGIARVLLEAFNITQDRIARSRLAGDPPDIVISPRLHTMGLFDFHRASLAIAEGYEATRRQLDEIDRSSKLLCA